MTDRHIQRMLQQATGLDLSSASVGNAVRKRMKQRHFHDRAAYVAEAVRDQDELGALIDLVVVPETWFFRDAEAFAVAARIALDLHVKADRPVRILSVPCAGGEEPYSLAMALLAAGVRQSSFIIDAVDVSPQAIRRAQHGVYKSRAFRTADLGFRDQHFIQRDDGFELSPDIRKLVQFRRGNLLTLAPLDGQLYDIIFCRNLLIYFKDVTQAAAIQKLRSLLNDDGLLFCGYAETTTFCLHNFTHAPYALAFAVQKREGRRVNDRPADIPFLPRPAWTVAEMPRTPTPPRPVTALKPEVHASDAASQNAGTLLENANRLADKGAIDEAEQSYRAYLAQVPDSAHAHFMLGLLNEQRGDDKGAMEFLQRAVYLDPNHYEALCHLSLLAERQGNNRGALNYRQRAGRVFDRRSGEHKS